MSWPEVPRAEAETTEEREVSHTVRDTTSEDRSLEEMASDLRTLSGQIMTTRVMGLDPARANGDGADAAMPPAIRLVGEMLSTELAARLERAHEQAGARQREELASLLLNHTQGMRATSDRVDRLMRRLEADRERDDQFGHALLDRLDAIVARQEELDTLIRERRRSLVPDWVAGLLALAAIGISIGSAVALHFGLQP
ncbi:hypothetical protein N825_27365 [Skermanella stibiiresistens SB22]|uniref:Uncharacterized protein n=1 Tax=Skermanella stibiiresistens SB22 TaxID=1385369 RepID=W9H5H4_9PROT|nr:hypothetical protein N825_27365 [Skermanella stibiiresistens SB22]